MPPEKSHFYYWGWDEDMQKFVVKEQLYPESRGWIEYAFDSEDEALDWLSSPKTSGS